MSHKVIELNDNALTVGDGSGILLVSPGFALASDKGLQLGDVAREQARIHPTNSFNKYWHELSLDPITHVPGIRHSADIAFAHLQQLAKDAVIEEDVVFAVPGNFTRSQLAILLGLVSHSPFNVVGMVDSAVAAAARASHNGTIIYGEMQLHQFVLTKVVAKGDKLSRESVIQVPGVGSQNFMDLMMQLATDLFIQQCRFNPQHNAESEQQLYNALPHWLQQDDRDQNSLVLELNAGTTVHTAKMPRESLVNNLSRYYQSIGQQVAELAGAGDSKLLVSAAFSDLPGLRSFFGGNIELEILPLDGINNSVLQNWGDIKRGGGQIELITALQRTAAAGASTETAQAVNGQANRERATHALIGSKAVPLGALDLADQIGSIELSDNRYYLDSGEQEFLLNQNRVTGRQEINLGDLIQFREGSEEIKVIQVHDV